MARKTKRGQNALSPPMTQNENVIRFRGAGVTARGKGLQDIDPRVLTQEIQKIAEVLEAALKQVTPSKTTVEFGLELTASSGVLVNLFGGGQAKGHFIVTLEWSAGSSAHNSNPGGVK